MLGFLPAALSAGSALIGALKKKKQDKTQAQNFARAKAERRSELDKMSQSRADAGIARSNRMISALGIRPGGGEAYFSPEQLAELRTAVADRPAEFIPNDISDLNKPVSSSPGMSTLGSFLGTAAQGIAAKQAYDAANAPAPPAAPAAPTTPSEDNTEDEILRRAQEARVLQMITDPYNMDQD
jgi:hypothetical protein